MLLVRIDKFIADPDSLPFTCAGSFSMDIDHDHILKCDLRMIKSNQLINLLYISVLNIERVRLLISPQLTTISLNVLINVKD